MLKFHAKENILVSYPLQTRIKGMPVKYVGRKYDSENRAYPAKEKPEEFAENSKEAARIIKLIKRDNCLFAADEYTAKKIGIKFERIEFDAGEWKIKTNK